MHNFKISTLFSHIYLKCEVQRRAFKKMMSTQNTAQIVISIVLLLHGRAIVELKYVFANLSMSVLPTSSSDY